jgi:hypothetical protein
MDGAEQKAICFGALLLGFYTVYMLLGPGGDGVILSIFIGALTAYGGYQLGRKQNGGTDRT